MGQCAHLRNYAILDNCQILSVAEIKEKLGTSVARRYGIPNVYKSYQEMLDKEDLDGIVCSQPFNRHGLLIKDIARYGLPIFTEKPLAASVKVGEEIVQALGEDATQPLILLVPEQATYQAERAILSDPSRAGYHRLQIISFNRLQFFLADKNAAKPRISCTMMA